MSQTFGEVLRTIRRSKEISQRELANKVAVDFSYISKLENDRIPPPAADTIVKICEVLDVQPESLLSLTGKLPSEIKELIGSNPKALEFLRKAHAMNLAEEEWDDLNEKLKSLR
jgi:transcriptional regulator with XRE-family HTH domain